VAPTIEAIYDHISSYGSTYQVDMPVSESPPLQPAVVSILMLPEASHELVPRPIQEIIQRTELPLDPARLQHVVRDIPPELFSDDERRRIAPASAFEYRNGRRPGTYNTCSPRRGHV